MCVCVCVRLSNATARVKLSVHFRCQHAVNESVQNPFTSIFHLANQTVSIAPRRNTPCCARYPINSFSFSSSFPAPNRAAVRSARTRACPLSQRRLLLQSFRVRFSARLEWYIARALPPPMPDAPMSCLIYLSRSQSN